MITEAQITAAVVEWNEARRAFCAVPGVPANLRFPPEIWSRLAKAEDGLRKLAEKIASPTPDQKTGSL